jgi:hypothetical protein
MQVILLRRRLARPATQWNGVAVSAAVLVTFPLLIGGAIYLAFRTDDLLMFRVAERAGLNGIVAVYRSCVAPLRPMLSDWVVFSLPHGLWSFSLVALFGLLWRHEQRTATIAIVSASVFTIVPELLQAVRVVPGTYSGQDLLTGAVACCLAAAVVRLLSTRFPGDGNE